MARVLTRESTLQGEIARIAAESGILARVWKLELGAGVVFSAIGVITGFASGLWWPAGLGCLLLFLGGGHYWKSKENRRDIGRFRGGAKGEEEVSKILETQLPESYMVLNDLSVAAGTRSAQNDHIVLGPNGIFVIETKAYSGRIAGSARDELLEQTKEIDGRATRERIKNPIPQNAFHVEVVKARLLEGGLAVDDVRSVIVFTNKRSRVEIADAEVPVIKPFALSRTILNAESKYAYDEDYLRSVARLLAPGVDF